MRKSNWIVAAIAPVLEPRGPGCPAGGVGGDLPALRGRDIANREGAGYRRAAVAARDCCAPISAALLSAPSVSPPAAGRTPPQRNGGAPATPSGSARGTDRDIPASFPRLRSSRMALGGHELGEAVEGSRLEGGIKAVRVVGNPGLAGIMALDSTGGGGRQARVKPPVVCFRSDFHEPEAAPVVYDLELMGAVAEAAGFADGSAPSSLLVFEKIGYQHASRYFSLFENDRGEIEAGVTISCLYRCVLFDRDLQVILMRCIGRFELRFKAAYSYILAARRGPFAHRDARNFKDERRYSGFLERYRQELGRQLRKGSAEFSDSLENSSRLADHGESDAEAEDIARAVQWLLGEYRDVAERCGVPSSWLDAVAGEDGDGRASESEGRLSALIGAMRGNVGDSSAERVCGVQMTERS